VPQKKKIKFNLHLKSQEAEIRKTVL
jgi:hypothetical protein